MPDDYLPHADIGFHDTTRNGEARTLRNDLTGALAAQVEFAQASTVAPTGNAAAERPTLVAERDALLLFTPHAAATGLTVEASIGGTRLGTLTLAHPNRIPAADQTFDSRGTVAYSLRTWTAVLPWAWVHPGLELRVMDQAGNTGTTTQIDVAAPTELVVNNIQLGMLTAAPDTAGHRFIRQPASGATDYFQTIPVSRLVMAKYEKVELDRVIVATGAIYDADHPNPTEGGVYSGDMRENVGKAQVSTGINLATFGITSSPMNQSQPGITNQRVIHHSAGLYSNGVQGHGLSGGNGMATLYDSVGNELSHELGHSYGLGHYPGRDTSKTGDDRIRNASHHMDSGWGWIGHRKLMRSNLSSSAYKTSVTIDGDTFAENLAGKYNFNTDAMAGGWDASPVSDYTHHTAYSLRRIQNSLKTLTADTDYPSGYRDWDAAAGRWVDAKVLNPTFSRPRPARVGGGVFTLLGGYNPADPAQTLLYPAFRSNYGVTFNLPQADVTSTAAARQCWVRVSFADASASHIALDASDGVKQLNINIAEDSEPTGAQVECRADGVTTQMGDPIAIATDLPPMTDVVVVGQEAGYEALRVEELARLEPLLSNQAGADNPVLGVADMTVLSGWADDLSGLSPNALAVAERLLDLRSDAQLVTAWLGAYGADLADADTGRMAELTAFLRAEGYLDSADGVLPTGTGVTVDGGKCLTLDQAADDTTTVRVTGTPAACTGGTPEKWFADAAGRLHPADRPDLCLSAQTPVLAVGCSTTYEAQRWVLEADGHVVRASNTNSAMDLNRGTSRPGLYGRGDQSNQIWNQFVVSPNTLVALLDATGLQRLWGAWRPVLSLTPSTSWSSTGWFTTPTKLSVTATDAFTGTALPVEVASGEVGVPAPNGEIALPEGTTTVTARATNARGVSSAVERSFRVDTVAPSSSASITGGKLALTGTDATSGVAVLSYRIDSGPWQDWTAPVTMPVSWKTLEHRASDLAGNVEPTRTATNTTQPGSTTGMGLSGSIIKVRIRPGRVTVGTSVRLRVRVVASPRVTVNGRARVLVTRHGKKVRLMTVDIVNGQQVVRVTGNKVRRPGRYVVKVTYKGSSSVMRSTTKVRFRVR